MIKKTIYYSGIIFIFFVYIFSFQILAGEMPDSIRVGLESVYKNAQKIDIHSETKLLVGYYENNDFIKEGKLPSSDINVTKASAIYYTDGLTYQTLSEAQEMASLYQDAFPAYIARNTYGVYSLIKQGAFFQVMPSSAALEVKDQYGQVILVSDAESTPLAFQGSYSQHDFPVTGVGASRKYRGAIEIVNKGGLTPCSIVSIEDYLYGVVPAEMPSSWPEEALKAQAVAARSLAIFQYNRYLDRGYNVVDNTYTQVYLGVTHERPSSNNAVDATRGEVIKYNGKVAEALFFSTSGGYTESAENVWGNKVAYLNAVPDTYETSPEQKPWTRNITLAEIDKCLAQAGANIGQATGLEIVSRTPAGRVNELNILGSNGVYTVKRENVRTFFSGTNEGSLKSRMFSFDSNISVPALASVSSSKGEGGQTLFVMSNGDLEEVSIDELKIMSKSDISRASNELVVKSKDKEKIIDTKNSQGLVENNTQMQNSEVIYGDFVVYGKGYGHGVGMSQSGAKGMALAGYNYESILKYYYQGITVER